MIGREGSSMATIQRPAVLAREILLLKNKRNGNDFPFIWLLFSLHIYKKKGNNEISVSKDVIYLRNLTNYVFLAKI